MPKQPTSMCCSFYASPIGNLALAWNETRLCALMFHDTLSQVAAELQPHWGEVAFQQAEIPDALASPLRDYFWGDVRALDRIEVTMQGAPFYQRVWEALRKVPAGQTISYNGLANAVGCPGGARAVGTANATNPLAIVVPCHRVIRSDGSIGGYGGGLDRKRWLLRHEGVEWAAPAGRSMTARPLD